MTKNSDRIKFLFAKHEYESGKCKEVEVRKAESQWECQGSMDSWVGGDGERKLREKDSWCNRDRNFGQERGKHLKIRSKEKQVTESKANRQEKTKDEGLLALHFIYMSFFHLAYSCVWKVDEAGSSETSGSLYRATRCHKPKDDNLRSRHHGKMTVCLLSSFGTIIVKLCAHHQQQLKIKFRCRS